MDDQTINPFSNYGSIIVGERYIARAKEIRKIRNRVLPWDGGNLAVVGDYRIGKSSLVYNTLIAQKEQLLKKRKLPVWINIGTFEDTSSFFRAMVKKTWEEIEDQEWGTPGIEKAYLRIHQSEASWSEQTELVQRFFEKVRKAGIKVICILDEFDHTRHLFHEKISGFQALRELSYQPDWKVTLVTCSRRTVKDIELQTRAISTFAGIGHDLYLNVFTPAEENVFFEKLSEIVSPVDDELKRQFRFFCGGHPYHMDQLAYALVEQYQEYGVLDFEKTAEDVEHGFIDKYDYIIRILREDGFLTKLLQILFGPVVDVDEIDIDHLSRFGFIRKSESGKYETYSEHFYTYLQIVERRERFWPTFKKMEVKIRHLVRSTLEKKYGEDWVLAIEKQQPDLYNKVFQPLHRKLEIEQKYFESRASQNVLEIARLQDLIEIVNAQWDQFASVFQQDHGDWSKRARILSNARAPLTQDHDHSMNERETEKAEAIIQELLVLIENESSDG